MALCAVLRVGTNVVLHHRFWRAMAGGTGKFVYFHCPGVGLMANRAATVAFFHERVVQKLSVAGGTVVRGKYLRLCVWLMAG